MGNCQLTKSYEFMKYASYYSRVIHIIKTFELN